MELPTSHILGSCASDAIFDDKCVVVDVILMTMSFVQMHYVWNVPLCTTTERVGGLNQQPGMISPPSLGHCYSANCVYGNDAMPRSSKPSGSWNKNPEMISTCSLALCVCTLYTLRLRRYEEANMHTSGLILLSTNKSQEG